MRKRRGRKKGEKGGREGFLGSERFQFLFFIITQQQRSLQGSDCVLLYNLDSGKFFYVPTEIGSVGRCNILENNNSTL